MAVTRQMNRMYPAPGGAAKVDGFSLDFSGDAEFQAMLLRMPDLIIKRAVGICRTFGEQLALDANRSAPVGEPQKGRRGGRLARSFSVKARPQWLQIGKAGVAVRSSTKYHHYQEFGVDKKDVRVLKFRTDAGKKVRKGQGLGRRYRDGKGRLNDGVRVTGYIRDIKIPANPFFGDVVRRSKARFVEEARAGMLAYISRLAKGEAA